MCTGAGAALKGYATVGELTVGLSQYFAFYNNHERHHQALGYRTPAAVYADGMGGGARIPDHFGKQAVSPALLRCAGDTACADPGQRCSAATDDSAA